ncbi:MAG: hypothetical protein R3C18_17470 [Planctomycetaceae bacterium]
MISTFSGCGGSSPGYQRGGVVLLAAEHDAGQMYAKNFPKTKLYHGRVIVN